MKNRPLLHVSRRFTAIIFILNLGACASPYVSLSEQDRSGIRKAPVVNVVHYASPAMYIQTPAQVAGLGLITSATGSQKLPTGVELARKYAYPEPTQLVANRLAEQLRTRGQLNNLSSITAAEPLPVKDEFTQYRARYASGIVIEINMAGGYMMSYQPTNWKTYQFVPFGIRARMIDPKDGRILWHTYCDIGRASDAKLTIDITEFEANNGARAKEAIQTASRICADQLVANILGTGN
jgi:hypothetical protein